MGSLCQHQSTAQTLGDELLLTLRQAVSMQPLTVASRLQDGSAGQGPRSMQDEVKSPLWARVHRAISDEVALLDHLA